jgi:hypothetical protein
VYYTGNAIEWNHLTASIGNGNNKLINAVIYYYSETSPSTSGNYWHYDSSGGFKISCNDDCFIDSEHFKVTAAGGITATSGQIAGWVIDNGTIAKKNGDGNPIVGMRSDNDDLYLFNHSDFVIVVVSAFTLIFQFGVIVMLSLVAFFESKIPKEAISLPADSFDENAITYLFPETVAEA